MVDFNFAFKGQSSQQKSDDTTLQEEVQTPEQSDVVSLPQEEPTQDIVENTKPAIETVVNKETEGTHPEIVFDEIVETPEEVDSPETEVLDTHNDSMETSDTESLNDVSLSFDDTNNTVTENINTEENNQSASEDTQPQETADTTPEIVFDEGIETPEEFNTNEAEIPKEQTASVDDVATETSEDSTLSFDSVESTSDETTVSTDTNTREDHLTKETNQELPLTESIDLSAPSLETQDASLTDSPEIPELPSIETTEVSLPSLDAHQEEADTEDAMSFDSEEVSENETDVDLEDIHPESIVEKVSSQYQLFQEKSEEKIKDLRSKISASKKTYYKEKDAFEKEIKKVEKLQKEKAENIKAVIQKLQDMTDSHKKSAA